MPPDVREEIVGEARRWMGTPWSHQQRQIGIGVDCVGLLTEVTRACGLSDFDMRDYAAWPDGRLLAVCREQMTEIPIAKMRPGDAVAIQYQREPMHVGLLAPYPYGENHVAIIHADRMRGKVCEHRLEATLRRLIVAAFRLPNVPE